MLLVALKTFRGTLCKTCLNSTSEIRTEVDVSIKNRWDEFRSQIYSSTLIPRKRKPSNSAEFSEATTDIDKCLAENKSAKKINKAKKISCEKEAPKKKVKTDGLARIHRPKEQLSTVKKNTSNKILVWGVLSTLRSTEACNG